MTGSLRRVGALAAALVSLTLLATPAAATSAAPPPLRPNRVLVISLPGLSWAELQSPDLPNLRRLLTGSAQGALIVRTAHGFGPIADGYLTLGAGTRSAGDHTTDGQAFEAGEPYGSTSAATAFAVRTGLHVTGGLVHLGIAQILATNSSLLFDARPGALGDTLVAAGFRPAVIANADQGVPEAALPVDRYQRSAVTALMQSDGIVPAGAVGPELLDPDPSAPDGIRLDPAAYERAFTAAWQPRAVVLAEASDLVRADAYRSFVTAAQWPTVEHRALQSTDALVGRLLSHVDSRRDAVVAVTPTRPGGGALGVVAVRAPGYTRGFLRSATTRRTKFVALVDVAPTILQVLGLPAPSSMEGRPMTTVAGDGSPDSRFATLAGATRDSLFRDSLIGRVTNAFIIVTLALALAALVLRGPRFALARRLLGWAALTVLGFLVAVFASVPLHLAAHGGTGAFWAFTLVTAVLLAAVYAWLGRRRPFDPLILALSAVVLLHVVDAVTGAHLELDAPWGYSPTVGIRLAGLGNLSFSQMAAAAAILAGLVAWRIPGRAGLRTAIGVLAITFLSLTPPLWGQNFGGTLASAPAFATEGWLLAGRRLRARSVAVLAAILVAAGLAVGFLDMLRPTNQQTHVGRFFQQVRDQGVTGFTTVLHRKGSENVSTLSDRGWLLFLLGILALGAWYWLRTDGPRRLLAVCPPLRACFFGLAVLVVLGYGLKDSGIAVPGMMLGVAALSLVYLDTTLRDQIADADAEDGPDQDRSARSSSSNVVP